ncbi:structural maintenance of chromosomes protein 4 isoform X1 [Polistes fuscatus]|uniref:structural maintenance of chromosomes protein 4 isoform X1 n=2 Tax=Polistes fuscatus TaxID=30207 RepID=UPI001CA8C86B|nr:structural maintenance of chromosomes protein 4 isoform X1 [Polistes fuscatus]
MANKTGNRCNTSDEMEVDFVNNERNNDEEGGIRIDDDIYIPPPPSKISDLDENGPRLMITKIVNENFKSYAGTQVIGPFHKCFSAIVGPNGSGKSNVIDSMLFVFGYKASKIRSKKISVLIHNSSQHADCKSCTVSVYFQRIMDKEGDDYEVVPNSEFVISRTAFKDNTSYYELNKKKVLFKEISKLLRSHGVDLDYNRFLILQGEVEQIAMMKPKAGNDNENGMLEFLEDIIGTVRFKEPLEKLMGKVELLSEYRVEKMNRLRIVEKEKAALQEPMQDAVNYLRMENGITKLQYQLYHCKRVRTEHEVELQEEATNEVKKDIQNLLNELEIVQQKKDEKEKLLKEKKKKWDKLQSTKDDIDAQFEEIRNKDEYLYAEMVETNKRRKENIKLVKTEKNKLEELEAIPKKNSSTIEEYEKHIQNNLQFREKEEAALVTLISGLRDKTEPLLNERSQLEKHLISLRKDVNEAKSKFDIENSKLQLYTSIEQTEREKLNNIKETLKTTVSTIKQRTEQLISLNKKIPATQKSLDQAQNEFKEAKDREIQITSKLKNLRISYEEKKSAMQASNSRNKILTSLMKEKMEGRIPGIFGRLGDLGAIDAKYDVAVSTACGPLDNIVVDTVSTAQACITFLRQNNIGRATFIALEKQQHLLSKCKQKINTPNNVPRLIDLIRVEDENVLPAFYYGLRDTLVTNNLNQATQIAYGPKRYRVVTLKGELIEMSGTMSGGGSTVLRGRMGQKVVRNEPSVADVDKLEKNLDKVYEECNDLRNKQQTLENQIHTLSNSLKDMTLDRNKFNIEVQTLKEQKSLLEVQLKNQEKKVAESVCDPKEIQKLKKTIDTAQKKLNIVQEKSTVVENKVADINMAIEKISGGRVKEHQQKISNLTKQIENTKAEIYKLQVAITTAKRNYDKVARRIEVLESDIHIGEEKLRKMQEEKNDLEETGKVLLEKLNEVNKLLVERDEATASIKEELEKLQIRENNMKAVKIDLDQKMKINKRDLESIKAQLLEYIQKINSLKLNTIPGEQPEVLKELSDEEINELNEKVVAEKLDKTMQHLPKVIPNMQIIADYEEKDKLYLERVADLELITTERNNLRDIYEKSRRQRMSEFLTGFTLITNKLKEMYQMITLGGDAELELVDSLDPFSEGIVFSVRPPKKSWKNISNLSGGEKTLSSLALVFALHHYKPSPLYFMDEIDAALDFKNVSIVGHYIKERTKNAQFIIISLRSNMFELADYLVGIYKKHNCTKSIRVNLAKYYVNNGIPPPTQITMSRNLYSQTQMSQMTSTNNAQNEIINKDKNGHSNGMDLNNLFELQNLSLCETPKKSDNSNQDINNEETNGNKEPARKKRKI